PQPCPLRAAAPSPSAAGLFPLSHTPKQNPRATGRRRAARRIPVCDGAVLLDPGGLDRRPTSGGGALKLAKRFANAPCSRAPGEAANARASVTRCGRTGDVVPRPAEYRCTPVLLIPQSGSEAGDSDSVSTPRAKKFGSEPRLDRLSMIKEWPWACRLTSSTTDEYTRSNLKGERVLYLLDPKRSSNGIVVSPKVRKVVAVRLDSKLRSKFR
ncbi:unnamed protein product, partial [Urochloa humidicola]